MKNKLFIVLCLILIAAVSLSSCTITYTVYDNTSSQPVPSEEHESEIEEAPAQIRPLLWKAESENGGILYLLGSIHIGLEEMYPLDSRIENAYNASEAVAVEVDVISMEYGVNNIAEQYQEYLTYNDGTGLYDHVAPELYNQAMAYLKSRNVSIYPYLGYKPCVLADIIETLKAEERESHSEFSYRYGVDRHYLTRAKNDGKKVLEVEDASTRYKMSGDYSDEMQEMLLASALYSAADTDDSDIRGLFNSWTQGDVLALEKTAKLSHDSAEYQAMDEQSQQIYDEYYDAMLTGRNRIMVKKAEQYLKNGMKVFYIVGSAHMVGEDGIINCLEQAGWKITEIN